MLVGCYSASNYGNVMCMSLFSDNLIVDDVYSSNKSGFTLHKEVMLNAFYYRNASEHFLSGIGTIQLNSRLDLKNEELNLSDKEIIIGKGGGFVNGSINVSGASILPNYNSLIENEGLKVEGIPAVGTYYFQKGKPTWSNGYSWVDANGITIE